MGEDREPKPGGEGSPEPSDHRPISVIIHPPSWRWIITLLAIVFAAWLVGVVLLVGVLAFVPVLALGPIVEHLILFGS